MLRSINTFGKPAGTFVHIGNIWRTSTRNLKLTAKQSAVITAEQVNESEKSYRQPSWEDAKPFSEIPGEKLAWRGLLNFLPGGKYHNASLKDVHIMMRKQYGNLAVLKGFFSRPDFIVAFDPKDIEQVYRNEGVWPYRRDFEIFRHYRLNVRPDVYGKSAGLLVTQGEQWKEFRGKVNQIMMQPRAVKPYITAIEEVADEFIARMVRLRDSNNELPSNFKDEMNKWSLESITRIALDTRLGCFKDDIDSNSDAMKMIKSVDDFFDLTFKLEVLPSFWKYIKTSNYHKLIKALDCVTNISLAKVDDAMERLENAPEEKSIGEASVLEKLLKIDKNIAVIMAMDMLLAGVDTTSYSTIILLYFLAVNQKAQDKLRAEILTILPEKDSRLSNDSLNHVPYLRACMKESTRMMPIIGANLRKTPVDLVLSGYQIPKGTEVLLSHMTTSMLPSQFPHPEKYIPERWLSEPNTQECPSAKSAHPFVHMPFGFGPRSCIGKRFADLEMETLIVKLLRNYKVEWNYGELQVATKLLATPESPLRYKITEL